MFIKKTMNGFLIQMSPGSFKNDYVVEQRSDESESESYDRAKKLLREKLEEQIEKEELKDA